MRVVKHSVKRISTPRLHLPLVGLNERFIFQLVTFFFFAFLIPYLIPHYHTNYLPAWVGTNPPRGGSSDFAMKYFINNHKLFCRRLFWSRFCLLASHLSLLLQGEKVFASLNFSHLRELRRGNAIKTNRSYAPLDSICHVVCVVFF